MTTTASMHFTPNVGVPRMPSHSYPSSLVGNTNISGQRKWRSAEKRRWFLLKPSRFPCICNYLIRFIQSVPSLGRCTGAGAPRKFSENLKQTMNSPYYSFNFSLIPWKCRQIPLNSTEFPFNVLQISPNIGGGARQCNLPQLPDPYHPVHAIISELRV